MGFSGAAACEEVVVKLWNHASSMVSAARGRCACLDTLVFGALRVNGSEVYATRVDLSTVVEMEVQWRSKQFTAGRPPASAAYSGQCTLVSK